MESDAREALFLRQIDDIAEQFGMTRQVPQNLYLSVGLDSRLGEYDERESHESKEEAAIYIILDGLDTREQV